MVAHGRECVYFYRFLRSSLGLSAIQDPFQPGPNPVFSGPGFRLPFYVVSPWTRGGGVFTAHSDHSSQIMFLVIGYSILIVTSCHHPHPMGYLSRTGKMVGLKGEECSDGPAQFMAARPHVRLDANVRLCARQFFLHGVSVVVAVSYRLAHAA